MSSRTPWGPFSLGDLQNNFALAEGEGDQFLRQEKRSGGEGAVGWVFAGQRVGVFNDPSPCLCSCRYVGVVFGMCFRDLLSIPAYCNDIFSRM